MINRILLTVSLLCPTSVVARSQPKWQAPKAVVIVKPGESVGALKIGMNPHEVHLAMGQPSRSFIRIPRAHPNSEIWAESLYKQGQVDTANLSSYFIVAYYSKGKVIDIVANLPKAELSDGFSLSSGFKDIRAKFKNLKYSGLVPDNGFESDGYQDSEIGIAFFYGVFDARTQSRIMRDDENPHYFEVMPKGDSMRHLSDSNWLR